MAFKVGSSTNGKVGLDKIGQAETVPAVISLGLQHVGEGIGDTGEGARVPQTLHTIEQGIAA